MRVHKRAPIADAFLISNATFDQSNPAGQELVAGLSYNYNNKTVKLDLNPGTDKAKVGDYIIVWRDEEDGADGRIQFMSAKEFNRTFKTGDAT
jgi:hypothetical protein